MYLSLSLYLFLYLSLSLSLFLVRSCLLITLIKCLKGHKSLGSLCSVVKALIVSGVRPTNQPTKGQGHLLSCSGQLKRNTAQLLTYVIFVAFQPNYHPSLMNSVSQNWWCFHFKVYYNYLPFISTLPPSVSQYWGFQSCYQYHNFSLGMILFVIRNGVQIKIDYYTGYAAIHLFIIFWNIL